MKNNKEILEIETFVPVTWIERIEKRLRELEDHD